MAVGIQKKPQINVVGVDLGGGGLDHTAIAISTIIPTESRNTIYFNSFEWSEFARYGSPYQYEVRHLERLKTGTNTLEIVEIVNKMIQSLQGSTFIVIDITAAGRTSIEPFHQAGLSCMAATITGGDTITSEGYFVRAPKRDLIGNLKIALEGGEVKIARLLPDADMLVRELMSFRLKPNISMKAGDMEEWREGKSDDLVFAVALSCFGGRWIYERSGPVLIDQQIEEYQV